MSTSNSSVIYISNQIDGPNGYTSKIVELTKLKTGVEFVDIDDQKYKSFPSSGTSPTIYNIPNVIYLMNESFYTPECTRSMIFILVANQVDRTVPNLSMHVKLTSAEFTNLGDECSKKLDQYIQFQKDRLDSIYAKDQLRNAFNKRVLNNNWFDNQKNPGMIYHGDKSITFQPVDIDGPPLPSTASHILYFKYIKSRDQLNDFYIDNLNADPCQPYIAIVTDDYLNCYEWCKSNKIWSQACVRMAVVNKIGPHTALESLLKEGLEQLIHTPFYPLGKFYRDKDSLNKSQAADVLVTEMEKLQLLSPSQT